VKSPKVYLRDTGILHRVAGGGLVCAVGGPPELGASWEGFVIEKVLRVTGDRQRIFGARTPATNWNLLVFVNGRRIGSK